MRYLKLFSLSVTFLILVFISAPAKAFDINNPTGTNSSCSGSASSSAYCASTASGGQNNIYGPNGLITDAINIISFIAGIASIIVLMIGGFRFIISGGDSAQVSSARNMILYALVGIVVIGAAQTIMYFLIGKL